jgi:hypothetical protein
VTPGAFQLNDSGVMLAISEYRKAGRYGQTIAERSRGAGHSHHHGTMLGGLDESAELFQGNRSPIVPAVFVGVESPDSPQDVFPRSVRVVTPLRERFDGGSMVVARRQ